MREELTKLVFLLDRSGFMFPLTDSTINGFKTMIERQKKRRKGRIFGIYEILML